MLGRRRVLRTAGALGIGAVAALLIAELFLRLFPGVLPEQAQIRIHWRELYAEGMRSVGHPYCGFTYVPNTSHELSRGDFRYTYTTDERGFRNPTSWPPTASV